MKTRATAARSLPHRSSPRPLANPHRFIDPLTPKHPPFTDPPYTQSLPFHDQPLINCNPANQMPANQMPANPPITKQSTNQDANNGYQERANGKLANEERANGNLANEEGTNEKSMKVSEEGKWDEGKVFKTMRAPTCSEPLFLIRSPPSSPVKYHKRINLRSQFFMRSLEDDFHILSARSNPPFINPPSPQPSFPLSSNLSSNQPLTNQPSINQPITNQPLTNQPITNQPSINQPPTNQPAENADKQTHKSTFSKRVELSVDPPVNEEDMSNMGYQEEGERMEGFIIKRGGRRANWKRRWVVVLSRFLLYFKSPLVRFSFQLITSPINSPTLHSSHFLIMFKSNQTNDADNNDNMMMMCTFTS